MIRNTMFGLSLLALTTGSAFAATPVSKHVAKPRTVAAAPAGDAAKADAPKTDAPKKEKKAKKEKAPKGDAAKTEGAKEMKAPPRLPRRSNSFAPIRRTDEAGLVAGLVCLRSSRSRRTERVFAALELPSSVQRGHRRQVILQALAERRSAYRRDR